MFRKRLYAVASVLALVFMGTTAQDCQNNDKSVTDKGEQEQRSLMQKAQAQYPVPEVSNFLERRAVMKWMQRMDQPSKTFYIYLMNKDGEYTQYYVGKTRPLSSCTLMTPPKRKWKMDLGQHMGSRLGPAPALTGVYYGPGSCGKTYFFFDANTDAFVELTLTTMNIHTFDQPIDVDARQITVGN